MNIRLLLKTLNQNGKLTRNATNHYLALLYLAHVNPYPSESYIATEVTEKDLKAQNLLAGSINDMNEVLTAQGLIKLMDGTQKNVYILGEKHKIGTLSGDRIAEVWFFEQDDVEITEHEIKTKVSKKKTYNPEFAELDNFYVCLVRDRYKHAPVTDYPKTRKIIIELFKHYPYKFLKACVPIYLELEDEFWGTKEYPLYGLKYKLADCRNKLDEKIRYYGFIDKQDEFLEKHIDKVIADKKLIDHEKWLTEHDGGIIQRQNTGDGTGSEKRAGDK